MRNLKQRAWLHTFVFLCIFHDLFAEFVIFLHPHPSWKSTTINTTFVHGLSHLQNDNRFTYNYKVSGESILVEACEGIALFWTGVAPGKGGHNRKKWEFDAAHNQWVYDMEPLLHFLKLHSPFESNIYIYICIRWRSMINTDTINMHLYDKTVILAFWLAPVLGGAKSRQTSRGFWDGYRHRRSQKHLVGFDKNH